MTFAVYLIANAAAALYVLAIRKRRIQSLEVLAYWLLSMILVQNYSAIFYMNTRFTDIPDILSFEGADLVNRLVLYPLAIVLFLDLCTACFTMTGKAGTVLAGVCVLTGLEWIDDWTGIHVHRSWVFWWSPAIWLLILLVSLGFMAYFRRKLQGGIRRA